MLVSEEMMFNVKLLPTPHNNISNIDFFIFKSVSGSAKSPKRASEKVTSFLPQVLMKLTKSGAAKLSRDATEPTEPENDETRERAAEIESDKILIPSALRGFRNDRKASSSENLSAGSIRSSRRSINSDRDGPEEPEETIPLSPTIENPFLPRDRDIDETNILHEVIPDSSIPINFYPTGCPGNSNRVSRVISGFKFGYRKSFKIADKNTGIPAPGWPKRNFRRYGRFRSDRPR